MVQYELSRIFNYSATCLQSEQTSCAPFLEEKRDFTTYGGKIFFFQLKRNVILWVEVSME
jgi:hypothetical protein